MASKIQVHREWLQSLVKTSCPCGKKKTQCLSRQEEKKLRPWIKIGGRMIQKPLAQSDPDEWWEEEAKRLGLTAEELRKQVELADSIMEEILKEESTNTKKVFFPKGWGVLAIEYSPATVIKSEETIWKENYIYGFLSGVSNRRY